MGKLEPIARHSTNWAGLWYHPEINGFISAVIDLADLRKFKGKVRLYVRKNKFYCGGENGRPNYNFCLRDASSDTFKVLTVEGNEEDDDGERVYTRDEVMTIIHGVVSDVKSGYTDLLPEDYV
jgi:hypothetical protein